MFNSAKQAYWRLREAESPYARKIAAGLLPRICEMFGIAELETRLPRSSPLYSAEGGERLHLGVDKMIMPEVLKTWGWQRDEVNFLATHCNFGSGILVDVGANLGLVTRQLMHRVPAISAAICFEPHPGNYKILVKNLSHLPQCKTVCAALASTDSDLVFYEDTGNVGNYSLNLDAMRGHAYRESIVKCINTAKKDILSFLPDDLQTLPVIWKSDTQGFDEKIMTDLPISFWYKVQAGVMEVWRINKPDFEKSKLATILEQFPILRFADAPTRQISVDEILAFSEGRDYSGRDVFFAR